jgi:hypothetical protein
MAQFVELELDQGTDFNLDLDLANDNAIPIDITNYSFSSTIRKSYYSSRIAANLTVTVLNAANGSLTFSLNAATTSNVQAGRYLFDVKQVDNANTTTRLVEGIITVNPQVTK